VITADGPVYVIAEIGINHNGSLGKALRLIDMAIDAGCDAVKFQKRNPDVCVPSDQRDVMRKTPWGWMSYIGYRHRMEFGYEEFNRIDNYCKAHNIDWFASAWDIDSVNFLETFDLPYQKVPSACLTDHELLRHMSTKRHPVILSTGMSEEDEIEDAVDALGSRNFHLAHCTSTYPCPENEINLSYIAVLAMKSLYHDPPGVLVGYSGHEEGIVPTLGAVALGARFIERHITLDKTLWGSDQAASLESERLKELVTGIREMEMALGDGIKRVYDSELPQMKKLRRVGGIVKILEEIESV
jgi:N-acetylneuraminate synthase